MLDVAIALFPTLAFGVYHFGPRALGVIVLCVLSSVLSELLFNLISKKKITIFDCSAYVTGLILAVNLPSTVPWYVPVLGGAFAIIVVKLLFGGLGQNFMNPALAARCFLLISFASQ
jgi:electron transport complex protein RnfD